MSPQEENTRIGIGNQAGAQPPPNTFWETLLKKAAITFRLLGKEINRLRLIRLDLSKANLRLGKKAYALGVGTEHPELVSRLEQLDKRLTYLRQSDGKAPSTFAERIKAAARATVKAIRIGWLRIRRRRILKQLGANLRQSEPKEPLAEETEHARAIQLRIDALNDSIKTLAAQTYPWARRPLLLTCLLFLFVMVCAASTGKWRNDASMTQEHRLTQPSAASSDIDQTNKLTSPENFSGQADAHAENNLRRAQAEVERQIAMAERAYKEQRAREREQELREQAEEQKRVAADRARVEAEKRQQAQLVAAEKQRQEQQQREAEAIARDKQKRKEAAALYAKLEAEQTPNRAQKNDATADNSAIPKATSTSKLRQAAEQFAFGHYEEAFKLYDEAISADADDPKNYLGRGWAFFCTSQKDAALKDFDQAIQLNPKEAEGYFRRGILHASNSEHELAINDFTQAIEYQPKYADAYHARGNSHFASKEVEKARDDFNNAIRIDSNHASAYVGRGRALIALHETDKAVSDFNRATELASQDPKIFLARGVAYFEIGRPELAQKDFERAISLSPEYVPAYQKLAALYAASKKEALASLNLGRAYFYSEEYGKATDQFERVTKLDPKMAAGHIELGRSLSAEAILETHAAQRARKRNGTVEETRKMDAAWRDIKSRFVLPALSSLEAATRIESNNAKVYLEIGKVQFYAKFEAAIPAFERAVELQPALADAHFWLGVAKYVHGDSRETWKEGSREEFQSRQALRHLNTAIELDPKHAGAYFFRARVHHWLKDYRPAIEDDDRSIALSSKSLRYIEFNALRYSEYDPSKPDQFVGLSLRASAYADRGDCHFSLRDPETARKDLDQSIASSPQVPGLFYSRGTIYNSNGDRTKALADFRRAAQLDPQNTHYSELITSMTVQRRNEWSSWQSAAAAIGLVLTTAVVVDLLSGDNNSQDYSSLYSVPARYHPYPMGGTKQQIEQWWREEKWGDY